LSDRVVQEAGSAIAIADKFPLTDGHTLVVPRRHVVSIYDLEKHDQNDLWRLVEMVRKSLIEKLAPDGFNIGVNDGVAAGQTVRHAHIHVIPRYSGDVEDARGGIRWVLHCKAAYWT
jgi:diadenosine tetraphosphate (Ap4A) HIT family hydrolase